MADFEAQRKAWTGFGSDSRRASWVSGVVFVAEAQKDGSAFDETTIAEHADLFPEWDGNWTGRRGSIVRDDGRLWKSLHDVGPGQNTKPSATPSMWSPVGDPGEEWPEWSAPLGAHDAYMSGDKVTHGGRHWTSDVDGNAWEPGVYGWTEAT